MLIKSKKTILPEAEIARIQKIVSKFINIERLQSDTRAVYVVQVRATIAQIMRAKGYSLNEIGDVLNRKHSSVIYLLTRYNLKITKSIKPVLKNLKDLI